MALASGTFAVFHTNLGDFTVKLFPELAPKTVENFVKLATGEKEYTDSKTGKPAKGKFYDGLVFHRVIKDFMVQGGDPEGTGRGGPGYRFQDEFHPSLDFSKPGKLAMANAGPNTNGSQFFITVKPTSWLNNKHTIFGEVVEGYEVVEKISNAKTGSMDRPVPPIVIKTLEISTIE